MEFSPLKYIYKSSGLEKAPTLLLLHGTGGNENDLLPFADHFGDKTNVLSVRGNVSENGMPRFFKRLGMGIFDEQDLEFRTHELVDFVTGLSKTEHFDLDKIVALGYSNGANIAGSMLVLHPDFLAGAILFRPMKPFAGKEFRRTNNNVPILMTSGKLDPTVDLNDIEKYAALLQDAGFNVESHTIPTGHNLAQSDLQLASDWFGKHFKK
ncbi:MAG: alpha/beta hydrolase [Flavobacterium sp.]|uniref:alpha/beta hydrolase n=1 Tax=Flavobacterium sp. TaxID=239 RepID=UPI0011FBF5D3|nr:alpha/beta hydrolase [Flavobacterium sp.]RZJ68350.1 MAG: alpha/beta hydrolase [Flavobacterium sp.]